MANLELKDEEYNLRRTAAGNSLNMNFEFCDLKSQAKENFVQMLFMPHTPEITCVKVFI